MKAKSLMLSAFCAMLLGAFSCTNLEPYKIDAPEDLADKIAEFQEEINGGDQDSDGPSKVRVTKKEIGTSDNSTGWWGDQSQSFEIPAGKLLHIEFDNWGSRENNWNNWNAVLATVGNGVYSKDDDAAYSEYFVLRSDLYGWGNADYDGGLIGSNYAEAIGEVDDMWAVFREAMYGAHVTIELDHSTLGNTYLTATAESADGKYTLVETYNHPTPVTESVFAFLTTDSSYMVMDEENCWLEPSKIKEIEDAYPVSLALSGFPTSVELGTTFEDVLGAEGITATATYSDGASSSVNIEDITFNVSPAFGTEVKTENVIYSYSVTKQGNYGKPVAGFFTIDVTNVITAIEAQANAYLIGSASKLTLSPAAIVVKAVYADNTVGLLKPGQYSVEFPNGPVFDGTVGTVDNAYTVKFTTGSGEELSVDGSLTIAASTLPAQTEMVGAKDFTNGWWTTFSQDWKVADGESQSVTMTVGSDNLGNWHSPCTILRKADSSEYGVVRMDNWGWGTSIGEGCALIENACDWNFDLFAANIDGSTVTITVANNGGFASIRYYVEYANEEKHFQYYDGIAVDSGDVQFAIVTEESYLIFEEETTPEPGDATIASIAVTKQPAVNTYYFYDNATLDFRTGGMEVTATYTDNTTQPVAMNALDFSAITVAEGAQNVTVSLKEDSNISTSVSINLVKGAYAVGSADLSSGFWGAFTPADKVIPAGESRSFEMDVYSSSASNWNGPVAVLRKADLSLAGDGEYAVVRIDNFGWGGGFVNDDANKESDWNWGLFLPMLSNSHVKITATNNGDNTASIRYDVLWANGEPHFQLYKNITIDSADVQFGVTVDGCYLVIVE